MIAALLMSVLALVPQGLAAPAEEPDELTVAPAEPLPSWLLGRVVAQVSLEAPRGGLPRESLEPLLRVREGEPLSLDTVRQDIALLVRAGEFAAVEVDAEPWFAVDENGEPVAAVRVVYRVYPPVRVERVDIQGGSRSARRLATRSHELGRGQAFFVRRDASLVERRVQQALIDAGWPEPTIELTVVRRGENRARVEMELDPGPPRELAEVVLAGSLPLSQKEARRELRRAGLKPGRRITAVALREGRERLLLRLAERGFLDPRVNLLLSPSPEGEVVGIFGEPGPRTELLATGPGAPRDQRLRELIDLQPGTRLSEGVVEDAVLVVRRSLQRRGRFQAEVVPHTRRDGENVLVVFEVRRGPRFRIRRFAVSGAQALPESTVVAALRQAAPEAYGRRRLVDGAAESAGRALEEVYRGRGYLDATVTIGEAQAGAPRLALFPPGRVTPVVVPIEIAEGGPVILMDLALEGGDEETLARFDEAKAGLVDQPWRPGELEALRLELAAELRDRGYLSSDVELEMVRTEYQASARLIVQPGVQARLRSVVVQGNQRTRRSVIERELSVVVGEPVGPEALEETRRHLYELDLFRVVDLELVGEDGRARDLILRLTERPAMLVELSGGVATDRGTQARALVAHRNIGGLGHRISLLGQAGYSWAGDGWRLDLAAPVWKAALRYEAPNLPTRGQRLIADVVLNEIIQEPTFRTSDSGASVGVRVRLSPRSEAQISYGGRIRRLEDVDPGALVQGDPWLDVLGLDESTGQELDLSEARRILTGPSAAVVLDRRDDPLDPTQGWRASGLISVSDGLVSAPSSLRAEGRFEHLLPLGSAVLALTGSGGLGLASGSGTTLAVEDRFYLGGTGSLRGFRPQTVGPANRIARSDPGFPEGLEPFVAGAARPADPSRWVRTGGDLLLAGSAELRLPLSLIGLSSFSDTALVGFVDLGRVSFLGSLAQPTSSVQGTDPPLRYGLGGGIRLSTAIGPVSLLLGANPSPIPERDEAPLLVTFTLGDL